MNGDDVKREYHACGSVRLRAIEPEDLLLLKKWRNELKQYYREYRYISAPHQERWYEGVRDDRRFIHYAIDVFDGGWLLVGSCNWSNIDWVNRIAELGIYIGDSEWRGKGLGLKAMVKLHIIAFHELNMNTVRLEVFNYNPAVKFYEDFGYKRVGCWRQGKFWGQKFHDSVLMDMTEMEWTQLYNERYCHINEPDTV